MRHSVVDIYRLASVTGWCSFCTYTKLKWPWFICNDPFHTVTKRALTHVVLDPSKHLYFVPSNRAVVDLINAPVSITAREYWWANQKRRSLEKCLLLQNELKNQTRNVSNIRYALRASCPALLVFCLNCDWNDQIQLCAHAQLLKSISACLLERGNLQPKFRLIS